MPSREIPSLAVKPDDVNGYRVFVCACGCNELVIVSFAQMTAATARKLPQNWYRAGHPLALPEGPLRCCAPYLGSVKIRA
jgi:hypothetical protein